MIIEKVLYKRKTKKYAYIVKKLDVDRYLVLIEQEIISVTNNVSKKGDYSTYRYMVLNIGRAKRSQWVYKRCFYPVVCDYAKELYAEDERRFYKLFDPIVCMKGEESKVLEFYKEEFKNLRDRNIVFEIFRNTALDPKKDKREFIVRFLK